MNALYEKFFAKKSEELKRLRSVYDDLAQRIPKMTDAEFAAELKKHDASMQPTLQGLRDRFKVTPQVISPVLVSESVEPWRVWLSTP